MIVWVPGNPKTKGSMEHIGRGRMRESVVGSTVWRRLMAERFRVGWAGKPPVHGGVSVAGIWYMPVPDVTAPRTGDEDKLDRNLLDALQDAGVLSDDVQVTRIRIDKVSHVGSGNEPGLLVSVRPISTAFTLEQHQAMRKAVIDHDNDDA